MNNKRRLLLTLTAALGLTAAATTAVAAPLPAGTKLTITPWVNSPTPLLDNGTGCPYGSCFGMGVIPGFFSWTAVEPGTDGGIIIGKAQVSGGQEVNLASTNPGELTAMWDFGGNHGTFITAPNASGNIFDDTSCTGAACGSNTTPRRTDLAVWNTAWGGLIIPMGSAAGCDKTRFNNCTADMVAGIFVNSWTIDPPTASPRNYELKYSQVVAEVFGNFPFKLILRGTVFSCGGGNPPVIPYTIPSNGIGEIGQYVTIGVNPPACSDPLQYEWRDDSGLFCTTATCQYLCTGLPAMHKLSLRTTDSTGSIINAVVTVKCGPPKVNGVWPARGTTGTPVFLFGKNFVMAPGTVPMAPSVKFNNGTLSAPILQVLAPDLLLALQPAGTTEGYIELCTAISCARTPPYNTPPSTGVKIHGLWPSEARVGGIVFIFGQNFNLLQGANKITVNGMLARIVQPLDSTILLFLVPPGTPPGPGQVCLTAPGNPPVCSPIVILP